MTIQRIQAPPYTPRQPRPPPARAPQPFERPAHIIPGIRSDPSRPGSLLVQATASLSMTGKTAVPLAVTALR